jgi:hypothetical protein
MKKIKSLVLKNILILYICFSLLFSANILKAQDVMSASGKSSNSSTCSVTYTIGQTVISSFPGSSDILTQGSKKANLKISSIIKTGEQDNIVSVTPNPTVDFVILKVNKDIINAIQYMVYDMNGKLLFNKQISGKETEISFNKLSNSVYFIKVFEGMKELKSFKIIKY